MAKVISIQERQERKASLDVHWWVEWDPWVPNYLSLEQSLLNDKRMLSPSPTLIIYSSHRLDIEDRIGELAYKEPQVKPGPPVKGTPKGGGTTPSGKPLKHERLHMQQKKMKDAQTIHKNPKIVEKVESKGHTELRRDYSLM